MNNIVTEKKSSYSLYEELINQRDRYKKDVFQYERGYVREFGELILAVFNKKIECIEKKKVIDFCQKAINRDEPIDQNKLNAYIKEEMAEFTEKLHHMEEDYREAKSGGVISDKDYLEVKRIYHRIVKKSLNEKLNATFLMVYYEIPSKRSLFMPSMKMKIPSICAFSTPHSLKMRELNRGFATSLKKLTRPFGTTDICNYE